MLKSDALRYFKTGTALAKALGISKGAVSNWGKDLPKEKQLVPPLQAARIERLTYGNLKFDPDQYPRDRHQRKQVAA